MDAMELETRQLLSIGAFARLSGLTIKALRHYDEIGLLAPAHVDDGVEPAGAPMEQQGLRPVGASWEVTSTIPRRRRIRPST